MLLSKLWKRRNYLMNALGNWGLHFTDVAANRNCGFTKGKKTIIFIRTISDIRIFKEAAALKNSGQYYTIFFTQIINRNLMRPAFDEIHPFFSVDSLVKKIMSISNKCSIEALHVSSPPAGICRRLLEIDLPWPIVFDQYDSWLVTKGPDFNGDSSKRMYDLKEQIADEKFCYANATAVISKTAEIDYIKTVVDINCPTLLYPDYAYNDWFVEPQTPLRFDDGRPHLVYAGAVHGDSTPDETGYSKFFNFARNLDEQRIHFHIYPSPQQTVEAKEYNQLAQELQYFHYHRSLPPWLIQKEIAQYDFGLDVAWGGKRRIEKDATATGVKFSTYLEAALPLIGNSGAPYDAKIIEEHELGFVIEDQQAIIPMHQFERRSDYQKNVISFRKKFSVEENTTKLINLYNSLSQV